MDLDFPSDPAQIPDIFIDVYTNKTFGGDTRIAYLRLKITDCLSAKPKPSWMRLRSPYNNTGSKNVGSLMASVQFLKFEIEPEDRIERTIRVKQKKQWYKFFSHIHHGFELAQSLPVDKLKTKV